MTRTNQKERAKTLIAKTDAVILQFPIAAVKSWREQLAKCTPLPVIWWCDETAAALSREAGEADAVIDGLLTPSMSEHEILWSLHFSARHFYEREQWRTEREKLLGRIEERKWIDKAKNILRKTRGVTEAEAYALLRTQAMNERKRMAEVAASLVNMYELMHNCSKKGAKR